MTLKKPSFSLSDDILNRKVDNIKPKITKRASSTEFHKSSPLTSSEKPVVSAKEEPLKVNNDSKLIPASELIKKALMNNKKKALLADYIEKSLTDNIQDWDVGLIKENPRYKNISLRYIYLSNNIVLMHRTKLIVVNLDGSVTLAQGDFGAAMFFSRECQEKNRIASLEAVKSLVLANDSESYKVCAIDALLS